MEQPGQSPQGFSGGGNEERARRLTIVLGAPLAVIVSVLALLQLL